MQPSGTRAPGRSLFSAQGGASRNADQHMLRPPHSERRSSADTSDLDRAALRHIVVGFDATASASHAAAWAIGLAGASGARVTLVHAVVPGGVFGPGTNPSVSDAAGQIARPDHPAAALVPVDLVVRPGQPDHIIADVAFSAGADLIVIGNRGHGPGSSSGLPRKERSGSHLASDLLHASLAPVMVIPWAAPHVQPDMAWIVGLDGQPGSAEALQWALARSFQTGGRVIPVRASRPAAEGDDQARTPRRFEVPFEQLDLVGIDRSQLVEGAGSPTELLRRTALDASIDAPADAPAGESAAGDGGGPSAETRTGARSTVIIAGTRSHGLSRFASVGEVAIDLVEAPPVPTVIVPYGMVDDSTAGDSTAGDRAEDANERRDPSAPQPRLDPSTSETVVRTRSLPQARDLVRHAEHAGAEASRLRIEADPLPADVTSIAANDRANIAEVARPAARSAVIGGVLLAAILAIGALLVGGGGQAALLAAVAGAITGLIMGALTGLYGNITINRDAIDQKGQDHLGPVAVREGRPDLGGGQLTGLSYQDEHDHTVRDLTARDRHPGTRRCSPPARPQDLNRER